MRLYPFARAAEVARAYAAVMAQAPDELCGGLAFLSAPPAPFVPPEVVGQPVVAAIVLWAGPPRGAQAGTAPLAALGQPLADLVGDMPYTAVQRLLDPGYAYASQREYMTSGFLAELDDESVYAFVEAAAGFLSPLTTLILQPLGGAYGRVAQDATALAHRDAAWAYQLLSQWVEAGEDDTHRRWTRELNARLQRHGQPSSFPDFVADTTPGACTPPTRPPPSSGFRQPSAGGIPRTSSATTTRCSNVRRAVRTARLS